MNCTIFLSVIVQEYIKPYRCISLHYADTWSLLAVLFTLNCLVIDSNGDFEPVVICMVFMCYGGVALAFGDAASVYIRFRSELKHRRSLRRAGKALSDMKQAPRLQSIDQQMVESLAAYITASGAELSKHEAEEAARHTLELSPDTNVKLFKETLNRMPRKPDELMTKNVGILSVLLQTKDHKLQGAVRRSSTWKNKTNPHSGSEANLL